MKRIVIILAMIASSMSLLAQNLQEVVYLKNGSIIKGTIIEQVPNESLKIQTADGSIFVYKISEVEKITKEATKPTTINRPVVVNYDEEEEEEDDDNTSGNGLSGGFRMIIETGYQYAMTEDSSGSPILNVIWGGPLGSHFFIGGGVGIRYYTGDIGALALPIYANIRWDIINRRVTPFIDAKGGYTPYDIQGYNFSAGVGCRVRLGNKFALSASLGVELQDYSERYRDNTSIDLFTRIGIDF